MLIRKRVYNSALVGYSGELMFAIWLKRGFGLSTKRILIALKDNAILSAVASGLVTAGLLVLFAATGNARRIVDWLHPGPALIVAGVLGVSIDPSLMVADEREILEDLIVAACNDARGKAETTAQEKMAELTKGLPLPPGMKLPF